MGLSSDVIERLPHVEGILNYLAPMADKPMNLAYDPPPGVPRSTGIPEPHRMTIYDARPVAARLSLDGEGLAVVEHRSAVKDFYDEDDCAASIIPKPNASSPKLPAPTGCWYSTTRSAAASAGGIDRATGNAAPAGHQRPQRLYGRNPARSGSAT